MSILRNLRKLRIPNKQLKSAISARNDFCSENKDPTDHVFKKIWTKQELIEHLINNVHYEDDNYIVFNKPYGVLSRINPTAEQPKHRSEPVACSNTLHDILPDLSERFGATKMSILFNPERCFSGVTVMSKWKNSTNTVLNNFSHINDLNRQYSFLTIVLGHPPETLEANHKVFFNKEKNEYELLEKKRREKGLITTYKHEVLLSSSDVSLVKVDLSNNHIQYLLLMLIKGLTPVLGDFVHSPRVVSLFDVPLLAPPRSEVGGKILRPEILKPLQLTPETVDCCPCHVHLYSTILRHKEKKFVVSVPPPEYFIWTCKQFGLDISNFYWGIDDDKREGVHG